MPEKSRVPMLWGRSTKSVHSGITPGWGKHLAFYIPAHDCDGAMQYRSAGWDTSPPSGWIWLQHVLTERCERRMGDIARLSRTFTSGCVSVLPLAHSLCHEDSSPSETWVQAQQQAHLCWPTWARSKNVCFCKAEVLGVIPTIKLTNTTNTLDFQSESWKDNGALHCHFTWISVFILDSANYLDYATRKLQLISSNFNVYKLKETFQGIVLAGAPG